MARGALPYSSSRPSLEYLSHLGPHRVSVGDLSAVGVPGVVFAPATGPRCPAVVFGHGYLQPVGRYADTLRYLASWGFVVAAPESGRGPVPSHSGMALDFSRTLDRLAEAKLGGGRVTVDRHRLAVAGHGIGGGAAVLAAAAAAPPVKAVVTMSAARVTPSAVDAARSVTIPGLHLVGTGDKLTAKESNGESIARAWAGPVQLRRLKGGHLGVAEGLHWTSFFLGEGTDKGVQKAVRELTTAFLLLHVAGHDQLAEAMNGKVAGTVPVDLTPTPSPSTALERA